MGDDEAFEAWNARRATIEPLSDEQLANLRMTADIGYRRLMPAPLLVAVLKRLDRAEAAVAKVRDLHAETGCWCSSYCEDPDNGSTATYPCPTVRALPPEGPA